MPEVATAGDPAARPQQEPSRGQPAVPHGRLGPQVPSACRAGRDRGAGHDDPGSYRDLVDDLVSAEEAGVYKPHPGIYRHLLATRQTRAASTLLVSANPFDIIGAGAAGLRTAWCRRQPSALFDPWGSRPDHVITGLTQLPSVLPGS